MLSMLCGIGVGGNDRVPRGGKEPLNLYEPNLGLKNSIEPFLKLTSH